MSESENAQPSPPLPSDDLEMPELHELVGKMESTETFDDDPGPFPDTGEFEEVEAESEETIADDLSVEEPFADDDVSSDDMPDDDVSDDDVSDNDISDDDTVVVSETELAAARDVTQMSRATESIALPPDRQAAAPQPIVRSAPPRGMPSPAKEGAFRLTTLVAGALLVALGVIYVWPMFSAGDILIPEAILAIGVVGLSLSLLAYWWNSGRWARGALGVALAGLLAVGLTAVLLLEPSLDMAQGWPLYLVALGGAFVLTFLGDRGRSRRVLVVGTMLGIAGLVALLVTLDQFPADVLDTAQQIAPWLLVILVIGLLPLAVRRIPHEE